MSERQGLLQDILADPADDGVRLIYADWLEEHGEPDRAEFIRVQIELARLEPWDEERERLLWRQRELLLQHEMAWVGPLADWLHGWTFQRGFLSRIRASVSDLLARAEELLAAAPIERVAFAAFSHDDLERLCHSPLLARLPGLDFSASGGLPGPEAPAILASSPHLDNLRWLDLSHEPVGDERGLAMRDRVQLLAGCPRLARVETLRLAANRLHMPGLTALATSPLCSGLVELDLSHNNPGVRDAMSTLSQVPGLSQLRRLRLRGCGLDNRAVAQLIASPFLRQIEELDLHDNQLSDDAVAYLASWEGISSVVRLDLGDNTFSAPSLGVLARSTRFLLRDLDLNTQHHISRDLSPLAAAPWLGNLRRLALMLGPDVGWEELADSPSLAGLRSLRLREMGDLALDHLARAEYLRPTRLELHGPTFGAEASRLLEAPALQHVTSFALVEPAPESLELFAHLTTSRPVCQPLEVILEKVNPQMEELEGLLHSPFLSRVRRLSLHDNNLSDDAIELLARSGVLAGVEILDLWSNTLTDQGLAALIASPHLKRLRMLDLADNVITNDGCAALAASELLGQLTFLDLRLNGNVSDEGVLALMGSPHRRPMHYLGGEDQDHHFSDLVLSHYRALNCAPRHGKTTYPSES